MIPLTDAQKKICQNPVKAIKQKCLDCSGWSRQEVELCPLTECALYPFRLGKNPFRTRTTRTLTDEQREALRERLKKARANSPIFKNRTATDCESESEESDMT